MISHPFNFNCPIFMSLDSTSHVLIMDGYDGELITNTVVFYFRSNMVQIQLWSWSCFLHSQNSWLIQLHHLSSQGILSLTVKDTTPFFNFFNIFDFFYQYFIYFICIINWCNEYNLHSRKRGLGKNISVVSQKIKQ